MSDETFKEASLRYHREPTPGKLEVRPTKSMDTQRDLSLAYSPGVAHACELIVEDEKEVASMTARGNLVGVITNGTAVLGLGNIGPLASKPVMEGKAVLFKKFANVDVFDIEIDENDPDKLVDIIASLEPTFGGINLEDIKAPECFEVEKQLRKRMKIPVFHDDQHGTAIVSSAAVYNGLQLVNKKIEDVILVASGAGAASIACIDLVVSLGLRRENVYICDSKGLIYEGRVEGMNEYKEKYAQNSDKRTLKDCMVGADIFFGLSGPGVVDAEMVTSMARDPLILAMANPTPEILPEIAREARPDAIIATGRSDYPNQVNNVLCFPYIFRGALDCGATTINEAMKVACVKAIAELAKRQSTPEVAEAYSGENLTFGPEYIIPKPFDGRLVEELPIAVVKAAMETGVATRPIEDLEAYRRHLSTFTGRSQIFMQPMVDTAKRGEQKIIYAEGENSDVLMAMQTIIDEKLARPVLLGLPNIIREKIKKLGLTYQEGRDFDLINSVEAGQREDLIKVFHGMMARKGVAKEAASKYLRSSNTALGAVLLEMGEGDGMICGKIGRFADHLNEALTITGPEDEGSHVSSLVTLLGDDGPLFFTDCFISVDPTAEELVQKTEASIVKLRRFGITPKVGLLSHSNFGSSNAPSAVKMRKVYKILTERYPDLEIEGEMHSMSALNEDYRNRIVAESNLSGEANLLVFPNLDSANIALGLTRTKGKSILVGPFISGLAKPIHVLIPSVSARGIYHISAMVAADIVRKREEKEKA